MNCVNPLTGMYYVGDLQPGDVECQERPTPNSIWSDGAWSDGGVPVPQSVTPLQARRAMRAAGVLDAVIAAVAQDPETQDAFEYATSFQRNSQFIARVQPLLPLSDDQIDDLFRSAVTFVD